MPIYPKQIAVIIIMTLVNAVPSVKLAKICDDFNISINSNMSVDCIRAKTREYVTALYNATEIHPYRVRKGVSVVIQESDSCPYSTCDSVRKIPRPNKVKVQ